MRRVFVDANVLFPLHLRDLFIELDRAGAITLLWSRHVQDEWVNNAFKKHQRRRAKDRSLPEWTMVMLERQNALLDKMLPDAKVHGYEEGISAITGLNDQDDRHVVAAAEHGRAAVVISFDGRAGLEPVLKARRIAFFTPDDFLLSLLADPDESMADRVIEAVRRQRADYRKPPLNACELLDRYRKNGLSMFADLLEPYTDEL